MPGFAPSVGTMLANFDWNYEAAAKAYCGLEAVVMTPDGRNMTMYLADGFDVKWLITPTSLDIVYGSVRHFLLSAPGGSITAPVSRRSYSSIASYSSTNSLDA